MEKAFKYRMYPNREQRILLAKTFGCTRFVYNHYLAKRKDAYEKDGITLSYSACAKDLVSLKKEYEWLKEVDSVALQSSVKNLDTAYINFFRKKVDVYKRQVVGNRKNIIPPIIFDYDAARYWCLYYYCIQYFHFSLL